jgi:hypothetical protein
LSPRFPERDSLPKKLASFRVATEFDPPTSSLFLLLWLLLLLSIGFFQLFFFFKSFFVQKEAAADVLFFYALSLNLFLHKLVGIVTLVAPRLTICNIFFFFFSCREKCPDQEIYSQRK